MRVYSYTIKPLSFMDRITLISYINVKVYLYMYFEVLDICLLISVAFLHLCLPPFELIAKPCK